ncbi:hypothetical protein [Herbidospora mongoliensis]|uniref:hypothetical protein n=1 Tax=Herbidospora mongoliensis TaxID=688067 RepID=UPI00083487C4|nr:hypothetical protein [Herbidospora mongoliensis]
MKRVLATLALLVNTQCAADPEAVYLVKNTDQTVTVYNTVGVAVSDDLKLPGVEHVQRITAADDGFHVLGITGDAEPRYFHLPKPAYTPELIASMDGVGTAKHAWAMTRDGSKVAFMAGFTGGRDAATSLVIRDIATGRETIRKMTDVRRLVWSPDGTRLLLVVSLPCTSTPPPESSTAICAQPEELRFLDADRPLKTSSGGVVDPVVTDEEVLVARSGGVIERYSVSDGRFLARIEVPGEVRRFSVFKDQLLVDGGPVVRIGSLTGGKWRDLPWDNRIMETAIW